MKYSIRYKTTPVTRTFNIIEKENEIFDLLYSKLPEKVNKKIILTRLSNGSLIIECNGYYIGRINLQGKENNMQILTSLYDNIIVNDEFDKNVDGWVRYINKYIIKEL